MPVAYASKTLAEKNGCLGCHAQNVKLVGPSYQEVAKKYAGDSDAKNRLADKIIHGGAGDIVGHSMRGGEIYIRNNVGYRCGIHMKEYLDQKPMIVVGGTAQDYLGEYMAGGTGSHPTIGTRALVGPKQKPNTCWGRGKKYPAPTPTCT